MRRRGKPRPHESVRRSVVKCRSNFGVVPSMRPNFSVEWEGANSCRKLPLWLFSYIFLLETVAHRTMCIELSFISLFI